MHGLEQVAAVDGAGVLGGSGQHPAAGLEAAEGGVDAGDGLDDVGEVCGQPAHHLGEREVGQRAVTEVEAVAGDDLPAVGDGEVTQLGEQPGLADAGVARQQHRTRRRAGVELGRTDAEQRAQLGQLGVTSYQCLSGTCCAPRRP